MEITHFNKNANRPEAVTNDGHPMFKVKSPRATKGTFAVCLLKEKPTYLKYEYTEPHNFFSFPMMKHGVQVPPICVGYMSDLLTEAVELCKMWPSFKEAFEQTACDVPKPMCHAYNQVPKATLIENHQSRFSRTRHPAVSISFPGLERG